MSNILAIRSAATGAASVSNKLIDAYLAAAKAKGVEAKMWAVGEQAADANVGEADVVLVGPQMRFKVPELKAAYPGKPIDAIDMRDYGMMNGKGVLARVAAAMAAAEADIVHMGMTDEAAQDALDLRFVITVRDREHLDTVLRHLRRTQSVLRAARIMPAAG